MESIIRNRGRSERENMWSKEEMLRYAWQVAAALSDVHSVGNVNGSPAIAHTDIDSYQVLWIDGMFMVRFYILHCVYYISTFLLNIPLSK